jgi:monoamine oxidase
VQKLSLWFSSGIQSVIRSLQLIANNPGYNDASIPQIAIIGGGPGGLMTGYLLQKKLARPCRLTYFEASGRLGGKVLTARFDSAPVSYEAGAAEFYDYSPIDEDSLKELIVELGLLISPMSGNSVILNNHILGTLEDVERLFGIRVRSELERFYWSARGEISPCEFYDSQGEEGPPLLAPGARFESQLEQITEPVARQYIETLIHSDLAAEPSQTNITYGLHNYLMNDTRYMQLYGIVGGNEQFMQTLAQNISADFRLNTEVSMVRRLENGQLEVQYRDTPARVEGGKREEFDFVVCALPQDALGRIGFGGTALHSAISNHLSHFHHPAHYLRISILFDRPFWQGYLADSYCMIDQLGGACIYDESSRLLEPEWGVLGWLLGGQFAQNHSHLSDETLIEMALDSLPSELAVGRSRFVEGKVHRWIGAVNAMPGGESVMPLDRRHQPEPQFHSNLFVVGDYLFDSTLNGVLDSAEYVSDWIAAKLNETPTP